MKYADDIYVIGILLCFVIGIPLILLIRDDAAVGKATKDLLRECLAHQEWCVEHYQLEEGK